MTNIVKITDYNAAELDIYARKKESHLLHYYEPKQGIFIAESPIVITRALDAGYEPLSFLVDEAELKTEMAAALLSRCPDTLVYTAEASILKQITGFELTRGMLCAMHRRELPSVEEVCANAKRIAVLEDVVNPTNIGAIFRSAAALNMDAVLLTPACSDPLYRRAIRVSMGTIFQVPWTYFSRKETDRKSVV